MQFITPPAEDEREETYLLMYESKGELNEMGQARLDHLLPLGQITEEEIPFQQCF